MSYTIELNDQVAIVRMALKIQAERWHAAAPGKLTGDPQLSTIDAGRAIELEQKHEALLARLPNVSLTH